MKAISQIKILLILIIFCCSTYSYSQIIFESEEIDSVGALGDLKVGFFNNDQRKDIVGTSFGQDKVYIISPTSGFDYYALSFDVVDPIGLDIVDFDEDGDSDLFVVGRENVYIAENTTTGQVASFQLNFGDVGMTNTAFAVGNFDDSAGFDIIVGSTGTQELLMFENLFGLFYNTSTFDDNNVRRPGDLHAVDLTGNGVPEIVYADFFNDYISTYEYDKVFQTTTETIVDNNINTAIAVNTGDFNNDGNIDIVGSSFTPAKVFVYLSNGQGEYEKVEIASNLPEVTLIEVGDLDNDLDDDIVGYNQKDDQIVILSNNDMVFERFDLDLSKEFNTAFALDDFDSDGKLDIITCADGVIYAYMNKGLFTSSKEISQTNFKYYPNPAFESVNIQVEEDVTISLLNLQGELIQEMINGNNDISSLANGMYLLSFNYGTTGKKLIKKLLINNRP